MRRINLRMAAGSALVALALLAVGLPAESSSGVSPDEARQVNGGQSGGTCFIGTFTGTGCNGGPFLGLKFWESCTSTPTYIIDTRYSGNDCSTVVTCTTTCGYTCGTYNAYVTCALYVPVGTTGTTGTTAD